MLEQYEDIMSVSMQLKLSASGKIESMNYLQPKKSKAFESDAYGKYPEKV